MTSDLTSCLYHGKQQQGDDLRVQLNPRQTIRPIRTNSRLAWLPKERTNLGIDVPVICEDETLDVTKRIIRVTYFEGHWHQLLWSEGKRRFALGKHIPEIDEWIRDPEPETSDEYPEPETRE